MNARSPTRASAAPFALAAVAPFFAGCLGFGSPDPSSAQPQSQSVTVRAPSAGPHASNVVVVIMENRDYNSIIGSSEAPYINGTLVPEAALMTNSHAVTHPSQPNYLALFSGSTQGITGDSCPHVFGSVNAGEELVAAGETFEGYSESMPYDGYTGCTSDEYARKHNPWVNFTNVPSTLNLVYKGFPRQPSTLTIVVPNLCNDMHDCSTQTGDTWLKNNLPPILKYDKMHNGLFILTWDEADPDSNGKNQIATLLIGPTIKPGKYDQDVTHYSTLRTIEDIAGIPCTADACKASNFKKMWR
jgi:phosphatidylinositol-3-phosphatase